MFYKKTTEEYVVAKEYSENEEASLLEMFSHTQTGSGKVDIRHKRNGALAVTIKAQDKTYRLKLNVQDYLVYTINTDISPYGEFHVENLAQFMHNDYKEYDSSNAHVQPGSISRHEKPDDAEIKSSIGF